MIVRRLMNAPVFEPGTVAGRITQAGESLDWPPRPDDDGPWLVRLLGPRLRAGASLLSASLRPNAERQQVEHGAQQTELDHVAPDEAGIPHPHGARPDGVDRSGTRR